jgi:hypothetical protein
VTGEMQATRAAFERISDVEAPHYDDSIEPALREVELAEKVIEAARDCVQAIEDAYGGAGFVPEATFEWQAANAARDALAALDAAKGKTT